MKKFIGKSAAIAAAALLFAQSMPMVGINAADPAPGTSNLTIHPYVIDDSKYNEAKNDEYVEIGDDINDKNNAGKYGTENNTIMFDVTQVDASGNKIANGYTETQKREFTGLPDGYYLVDPLDSSTDANFSAADAFIIQLPVPKSDGSNNRDVHIYPKLTANEEKEGGSDVPDTDGNGNITDKHCVTLTKTDAANSSTAVQNAVYDVYFKNAAGAWEAVENTYTTDTTGKITITGLPLGNYYFVEKTAPTGYLLDQKPLGFTIDGTTDKEVTATNDKLLTATKKIAADGAGETYNWVITADISSKPQNLVSYTITDAYTGLKDVDVTSVKPVGAENALVPSTDYNVDKSVSGKVVINLTPAGLAKLSGNTLEVIVTSKLDTTQLVNGEAKNEASISYQYAFDEDNLKPGDTDIFTDDDNKPDIPDLPNPNPENPTPGADGNPNGNPGIISFPENNTPDDKKPKDEVKPGTFTISNVEKGTSTELEKAEYSITNNAGFTGTLKDTDTSDDHLAAIVNFAPGIYTVTQTKVDGSYLLDDSAKVVYISEDGKMYTVDADNKPTTTEATLVFENQKTNPNFAPPFTGTTATRVFTITGICVMLAAGIFIFILLKKKDEDEEENKG